MGRGRPLGESRSNDLLGKHQLLARNPDPPRPAPRDPVTGGERAALFPVKNEIQIVNHNCSFLPHLTSATTNKGAINDHGDFPPGFALPSSLDAQTLEPHLIGSIN